AVTGSIVFTQLSTYRDNTCGVATGGTVYCWGANDSSQTGQAPSAAIATPSAVTGTGYTYVAVGGNHACALTATGISCWGANSYGQLGRGTLSGATPTPAPVSGTRTYSALSAGSRTSGALPV